MKNALIIILLIFGKLQKRFGWEVTTSSVYQECVLRCDCKEVSDNENGTVEKFPWKSIPVSRFGFGQAGPYSNLLNK